MMINRNVRGYFGLYTGEGVKPLENCEEILGDFENGDKVIVFIQMIILICIMK